MSVCLPFDWSVVLVMSVYNLPGKICTYLFLGMNGTSNIPQLNYKVSNDKNIADFHELAVLHTIMYSPSV